MHLKCGDHCANGCVAQLGVVLMRILGFFDDYVKIGEALSYICWIVYGKGSNWSGRAARSTPLGEQAHALLPLGGLLIQCLSCFVRE
jgi:hypothetical protein